MGDGSAPNDWHPAPYGEACSHCVRAKCKCFIRSGGIDCERCHRLNKSCQRAVSTRKRKQEHKTTDSKRKQLSSLYRPEESGASNASENALATPDLTPSAMDTAFVLSGHEKPLENDAMRIPKIVMDTGESSIILERQKMDQSTLPSLILKEISGHQIGPQQAAEQLAIFRNTFLPVFPCVHIPNTMKSEELRASRPFLWLVIMALTQRVVSQQFTMVDTIWRILSHRVVTQHYAHMDLLLGSICLSAWSHYFKEDRPFMDMLTHLAVSMAFDLNLHQDRAMKSSTREKPHRLAMVQLSQQHPRSLEEHRTIIALYHLSYATWKAYRKTEPIRWNAYMDRCLSILYDDGTDMDRLLTAQVHCQLISAQADPTAGDELIGRQGMTISSAITTAALLRELTAIQQKLPVQFQEDGAMKLYLWAAELTVRERVVNQSRTPSSSRLGNIQKLKDLENVLDTASRWLELLLTMPVQWWLGITTDLFAQFMHCLIVLFRLTTVDEPGWDVTEARKQADVLVILDRVCESIEHSSDVLGIDDTIGPRRGISFKAIHLLKSLRTLFVAEMSSTTAPTGGMSVTTDSSVNTPFTDLSNEVPEGFWMGLLDEPWFADIFDDTGVL